MLHHAHFDMKGGYRTFAVRANQQLSFTTSGPSSYSSKKVGIMALISGKAGALSPYWKKNLVWNN
jgi:hypothetical protein